MTISIVIPAFNEEKLLANTLRTVRQCADVFEQVDWHWEIVVCDNNSTDSTAQIATQAGARVTFEPVNQIARARNAGAAATSGDWFLFIDADTLPSHRLFTRIRNLIRGGGHLAAGANIRFHTDVLWAQGFTCYWNWISRTFHWAAGSFIAVESAAFREVGGFNNDLFVSEEIDLSIRLNRLARSRGLEPLAVVTDPLIDTSGRKLDLYSTWEHTRFMLKGLTRGTALFQSPEHCHIWYDGRR